MKKLLCVLALLLAACGAKSPEEAREIINSNFENTRDRIKSNINNAVDGWSILNRGCDADLSDLQQSNGLELFNGKPMNGLVCAKIVNEPSNGRTIADMRGMLASVLSFKDGKQDGTTIQFSQAGSLASVTIFKAGLREGRAQLLLSWQAEGAHYEAGEQTFELSYQGGVAVEGSCTLSQKVLNMDEILAFNNANKAPDC